MSNDEKPSGRWSELWRKPRSRWWLGIPLGGLLAFGIGSFSLAAFVGVVEATNTEAFCISCHEMRDNVYEEYKITIHFNNRSGVRATCSDCHVPKAWGPKLVRKVEATFKELPNHLMGKLNTREKFEAHRAAMAQGVWDAMKKNDSRECRNCHDIAHMDLERQDKSARRKHSPEYLAETGATCIDCHKGIAHTLPELAESAPGE